MIRETKTLKIIFKNLLFKKTVFVSILISDATSINTFNKYIEFEVISSKN